MIRFSQSLSLHGVPVYLDKSVPFLLHNPISLLPHNLEDAWPIAVYQSRETSYASVTPNLSGLEQQMFISHSGYLSTKGQLGEKGNSSYHSYLGTQNDRAATVLKKEHEDVCALKVSTICHFCSHFLGQNKSLTTTNLAEWGCAILPRPRLERKPKYA